MPEFTIYLVPLDLRVSVFSGLNLGNDFSFWSSVRSCFRKYKGEGVERKARALSTNNLCLALHRQNWF